MGVGWVVDCAEKRQRSPEKRFEADLMNVHLIARKVRESLFSNVNDGR